MVEAFRPAPVSGEMKVLLNDDKELDVYKEWRSASGGDMLSAMKTATHYEKQTAAFTVRKPHHNLEDVFSQYQSVIRLDKDPKRCTWDEVLDHMEAAQSVYTARASGNPIRTALRHGRVIGETLGPLAEMIPEEDGLSVLRGGLVFIFKMVQKREENREKIFHTFQEIPMVLSNACEKCKIFPGDQQLRQCVQDLCATLFYSIPKLADILLHKHNASLLDPMRILNHLPTREAVLIDEILHDISIATLKLSQCRENIVDAKLVRTEKTVVEGLQQTKAIRQTVHATKYQLDKMGMAAQESHEQLTTQISEVQTTGHDIRSGMLSVRDTVVQHSEDVRAGVQGVDQQVQTLTKVVETLREEVRAKRDIAIQSGNAELDALIQTGIYRIVIEHKYVQGEELGSRHCPSHLPLTSRQPTDMLQFYLPPDPDTQPANISHFRSPSPYGFERPRFTTEDLLDAIAVPHLAPTEDLLRVQRHAKSLKEKDLGHTAWLIKTDQFRHWLASAPSDILVVDGHSGSSYGTTSPMAVFTGSLASSLISAGRSIVLHHFCGAHKSPSDPLAGPLGLIRSLVMQLLVYPDLPAPTLAFVDAELSHWLAQHDLGALLHCFNRILRQSPRESRVFCVIDGISEFETMLHGWRDQVYEIVMCLQRAVCDDLGFSFKVLLTNAGKSVRLAGMVEPRQHVSLRAGNAFNRPVHANMHEYL
ncbi:hypothetical protein ACRALDRAFT_2024281 [Sodiomyces alcalophilus JCM 7366]|uniref:uncharacterized protein n=1 Tax=Sodiomyces alcalophilus JCM 7366 TaxID=591952 RepID=UPI0039B6CAA3